MDGKSGLTAEAVRGALGPLAERVPVEVLPVCRSTNLLLKQRAADLPEWHTVIAGEQTGGRGRLGRHFFSPAGTGLYMSVLLRPPLTGADAALITPAAAVAVCRALEELGSDRAEIKWVNDVLIRGRKVCGILTEAVADPVGGGLCCAVLGVGVNLRAPAGGFPPEAADVAGAVFPEGSADMRAALAAAFLRRFRAIYAGLPGLDFVEEYRSRCRLAGRRVTVLRDGTAREALALGVDERCRLLVRWPDGTEQALFSGEISIRTPAG